MSDSVNTLNIREYTFMPKNPAIVIVAGRHSGITWTHKSIENFFVTQQEYITYDIS